MQYVWSTVHVSVQLKFTQNVFLGWSQNKNKLLTHPCIFFHFVCVIKIAYTVDLSILLLQHGGIGPT